jgi:NADPH-dependent F420 reductase
MRASVGTLIAAPERVKGIFVDRATKIARPDRPLATAGAGAILAGVGLAVLAGPAPRAGLALRFAAAGETVVIGSRSAARAVAAVETIRTAVPAARVSGAENGAALASTERMILAFPFGGLAAFLAAMAGGLAGKLVIDVIVPLAMRAGFFELAPVPGAPSVGELIQQAAPSARVVSAFKNLSAEKLRDLATPVDGDVVLCGNDASARAEVARLVGLIPRLRAVDAGGIANARYLEAITALLLNLNRRHAARTSIAILGLD